MDTLSWIIIVPFLIIILGIAIGWLISRNIIKKTNEELNKSIRARNKIKEILMEKNESMKVVNNEGNWPEDFDHENGHYQNICVFCKQMFTGHKRRIFCKTCSMEIPCKFYILIGYDSHTGNAFIEDWSLFHKDSNYVEYLRADKVGRMRKTFMRK